MRIGHGFDIHRFEMGKPLIIGGVHIPFPQGMKAHSDGDVLLHAVCDALLGAAALKDIGSHFPDTDPRYKGIDSRTLLCKVVELLQEKGFSIQNIDATIVAEKPKMAPHIEAMCDNLAKDTGLDRGCINIKATTMEKLGPIGQGEAIAVHAVVLLGDKV
ncbi:MAG TPA: 2-C-methyl-D-erythritol 2,4-cyclodiphosphate synthase [Gammaproteobacteria bacterium]|nr:2-C-methyl-D-erythritol 2,4-cyclodiphosphate synthase [Gammaproteobacteria bacterium]